MALLAAGVPLGAQRRPRTSTGPRALAVIYFPIGSARTVKSPGTATAKEAAKLPRIYPVCVYNQRRYFDAAVYLARPQPMALEAEVVYEAQRSGEPAGLFTVDAPTRQDDAWQALGRWRLQTAEDLAAAPAKNEPPPEAKESDEPPRLRRAPASKPAEPAPPPSKPAEPVPVKEPPPGPPEVMVAVSDATNRESQIGRASCRERV